MFAVLVKVLLVVLYTFGSPVGDNGHVDLCNGVSVDNVDHALYLSEGWLLNFDADSIVYTRDDCQYHAAVSIESDGIYAIDF